MPRADAQSETEAERRSLERLDHYKKLDSGYAVIQSTRPQTVGYGLVDSPAAQAAWILEKFWAWTGHNGHLEDALTRDQLLDNVMMYWLPGAGASSARSYWESHHSAWDVKAQVTVPSGFTMFPSDVFQISRRWAEEIYTDIRYWSDAPKGGHFPAFEQPELFVNEVRACFRQFR
jgi:pimeloyl-ACP methyl ester carboxylesterase